MSFEWSQSEQYIQITTKLGANKFYLAKIEGVESISTPFHYRLELMSDDMEVDLAGLCGSKVTVTVLIDEASGKKRYIHGVVGRVSLVRADPMERAAHYEMHLHPWLWLLQFHADCRIFQNKSVPDIIKAVFNGLGFTDYRAELTGTYAELDYCVQYRESSFNFVSRLMEEVGIFYFFEHADGKHTLVFADDASKHADCPGYSTIKYRANQTRSVEDDIFWTAYYDYAVVSTAVGVDDFNFTTPSTDLYTKSTGSWPGDSSTNISNLAVNDYPGRYLDTSGGDKVAKTWLEALTVQSKLLRGEGWLRTLVAGHKVKVQDHMRTAMNGDYVLQEVRIEATAESWRTVFTAFPKSVPYRAPRRATKPVIPSTQTAIVVGPSGEEIYTDEYGRVKVQFHWDRLGQNDENSSCWIRVAHGWAGKSWGMIFLPRIGQEVVVSFLEGDPDRPLITGSVYNAEQTVPYALPDNMTQSTIKSQSSKNGTGKFNELRFEDKIDEEQIYIHAQKNYDLEVENDVTRTIKHDETVTVTNDCTVTIDHDNIITVKNNRTRKVTEGNDELKVETGTRTVEVQGKETHTNHDEFEHTVDKDYTLTVSGNLTIKVTGDLAIEAANISIKTTSGKFDLTSAAAMTAKAAQDATFKSDMAVTVQSGTDLTAKAGTNAKLEGAINTEVKAGAQLKAEGAMFEVKGSGMGTVDGGGMLNVKGGMVKIN